MPVLLVKNVTPEELKKLKRLRVELDAKSWKDLFLKMASLTVGGEGLSRSTFDSNMNALRVVGKALRDYYGWNPEPIQYEIGRIIGRAIAKEFVSTKFDELLAELSGVWQTYNMGEMVPDKVTPLQFEVGDCFDCPGAPDIQRNLCPFKAGVFTAIFEEKLGLGTKVQEIQCCANKGPRCKFTVIPATT